jgi:hypothetical protein
MSFGSIQTCGEEQYALPSGLPGPNDGSQGPKHGGRIADLTAEDAVD